MSKLASETFFKIPYLKMKGETFPSEDLSRLWSKLNPASSGNSRGGDAIWEGKYSSLKFLTPDLC